VSILADRYPAALVTGASTGLGAAFADMLLAEGIETWGTSRDARRLAARPRFHAVALDLADGDAAEQAFLDADRAAGGFGIVVNNAGYGVFGGFVETDFAVWQAQLEVMLVNTARLARLALRGMLARDRGALVNVSSGAARFPLPFQGAYNMAKAGLAALSESLMVETAGSGVIVLDLQPGDYRTDFERSVRRAPESFSPRQRRAWEAFTRMMRSGPPPSHAAAALRRALRRGRSGTVRTGRFFQAVLGPFLARLGPSSWVRAFLMRYFKSAP
jgi:short-subunit dehydrogenase